SIRKKDGTWHAFTEGRGSYDTFALVVFLRNCSEQDAEKFCTSWLTNHPGTGSCDGVVTDEEEGRGVWATLRAETTRAILGEAVPLDDPKAEQVCNYLRGRGLLPPYPASVRCLPLLHRVEQIWRHGECALVIPLTAHDRIVGCQLVWLTALGEKSTEQPVKQ